MACFPFCKNLPGKCLVVTFLLVDLLIHLFLIAEALVIAGNGDAKQYGRRTNQTLAQHLSKGAGINVCAIRKNACEKQGNGNKPDRIPIVLAVDFQEWGNGIPHQTSKQWIQNGIDDNRNHTGLGNPCCISLHSKMGADIRSNGQCNHNNIRHNSKDK